jgi:hypothetical protein
VLTNLTATNAVRFSVVSGEVPDPRETSLRPQLAVLAVTRPIAPPTLAITVQTNQANLTIMGETNRTNASFVSSNTVSQWSVPATNATRFFRVTAQ